MIEKLSVKYSYIQMLIRNDITYNLSPANMSIFTHDFCGCEVVELLLWNGNVELLTHMAFAFEHKFSGKTSVSLRWKPSEVFVGGCRQKIQILLQLAGNVLWYMNV